MESRQAAGAAGPATRSTATRQGVAAETAARSSSTRAFPGAGDNYRPPAPAPRLASAAPSRRLVVVGHLAAGRLWAASPSTPPLDDAPATACPRPPPATVRRRRRRRRPRPRPRPPPPPSPSTMPFAAASTTTRPAARRGTRWRSHRLGGGTGRGAATGTAPRRRRPARPGCSRGCGTRCPS